MALGRKYYDKVAPAGLGGTGVCCPRVAVRRLGRQTSTRGYAQVAPAGLFMRSPLRGSRDRGRAGSMGLGGAMRVRSRAARGLRRGGLTARRFGGCCTCGYAQVAPAGLGGTGVCCPRVAVRRLWRLTSTRGYAQVAPAGLGGAMRVRSRAARGLRRGGLTARRFGAFCTCGYSQIAPAGLSAPAVIRRSHLQGHTIPKLFSGLIHNFTQLITHFF